MIRIVALVCMVALGTGILNLSQIMETGFSPMVLIPFFMFVFGYGMVMYGFKTESRESKEFLARILEANIRKK